MTRFAVVLLGVLLAGLAVGCGNEKERNMNLDRDKPQIPSAKNAGQDKDVKDQGKKEKDKP